MTSFSEHATVGRLGIKRMRMNRHDDSQRSGRPGHPTVPPPPVNSLCDKQLTAPADCPVRDPARADAFTAAVAIGSAGSVHRRTGMRIARALPGDRNVPDPRPPTAGRTHMALQANQIRCFADHHPMWGCDAGTHVRGAVGACIMGRTCGSHLASPTGPRQTASVRHLSGHPATQEVGVGMIIADHPLRTSRRAELPHRAPASGKTPRRNKG